MNTIGLCHHNNMETYCPSCIREKSSNSRAMGARLNRRSSNMRGMGATCQPGYYNLKVFGIDTGQCLPTLSTAASGAQSGVVGTVATGVATSPTNISAAKEAGITALANKSIAYVKAHPVMIASVIGGIAILAMYGTGKLAFGRS